MSDSMNVLFVASEVAPYAKSGGLADVASALPKALSRLGQKVKVVLPFYSSIDRKKYPIKLLMEACAVKMGSGDEWYSVHHLKEPNDGPDIYFIEYNRYFERASYYDDQGEEYKDNALRFSFFCRAALQLAKDLNFKPDVVHVNDWHTSLIPYYLKVDGDPFFKDTKSVLTIHNIRHQGIFDPSFLSYARIRHEDFNAQAFEAFGKTNLLKAGIWFADKITTVSPNYAKEVLTHIGSFGLQQTLLWRQADLSGILNGIDTDVWDPRTDADIAQTYDKDTFVKGKALCKVALQEAYHLDKNPHIPLFAFVGRLDAQKGITMIAETIEDIMKDMICQIVILGSGQNWAENYFRDLPARLKGKVGSYVGYKEDLAHRMIAGADFFLMPSLFEPCGLTQMYSLRYGTLPVVRATGGLEDTVSNYNQNTAEGTGFKFYDATGKAFYDTVGWAVSTYYDRPHHVFTMRRRGMEIDFSWDTHAREYIDVYRKAKAKG